jgi:GDPmannose 4,6-dehydratase
MMKKALITGITGQDGSYLTELLLTKGYEVHGIRRRTSSFNTWRIDHLWSNEIHRNKNLFLHDGDMTDSSSLYSVINRVKPHEIYNLAAQSHVGSSFLTPNYTSQVNGIGVLNLLEAIRECDLVERTKIYQASTSELFGSSPSPQSEETAFNPLSPYAISKLYGYELIKLYRDSYGFFASNGILFNHESSRRGGTFVTQKIVRGLLEFKRTKSTLWLGNLDAERDWGHAKDYVEAMWRMLQLDSPVDLVVSTGHKISVKQFADLCASRLGIEYSWEGEANQRRASTHNGDLVIGVSKEYFRPMDVMDLQGDATLARELLKWTPSIGINELIDEMILNQTIK